MTEASFSGIEYVNVSLPKKPQLASWLTIVDIGDSRLQFRGGDFLYTLCHQLFIDIFSEIKPKLDGNHSVEDISSAVGPSILPTTVIFLLKILRAHGILHEGELSLPNDLYSEEFSKLEPQIQFFSHLSLNPLKACESLRQSTLAIIGEGKILDYIIDSLTKTGFKSIARVNELLNKNKESFNDTLDQLKDIDILIACNQSSAYQFFEEVNTLCLETQTRWLRVAIEGTKTLLGPTIVPRNTACYVCLCKRQESHQEDLESFLAYREYIVKNNISNDEGFFSPLLEATASQVSMEVARIILGFIPPQTIGRFFEFNVNSPGSTGHNVFRLPRCPACNTKRPKQEAWDRLAGLANE